MSRIDPALLDPSRYPFRHEVTTRFADLDPNAHINNVAMIAVFEDTRYRFDRGVGFADSMARNRPLLASNNVDYLAEAFYPENLIVHAGVLALGRTSWTLGCLAMQRGRPVAFLRAVMVCTDGTRPIPLPDAFRTALSGARIAIDPTP